MPALSTCLAPLVCCQHTPDNHPATHCSSTCDSLGEGDVYVDAWLLERRINKAAGKPVRSRCHLSWQGMWQRMTIRRTAAAQLWPPQPFPLPCLSCPRLPDGASPDAAYQQALLHVGGATCQHEVRPHALGTAF